MTIGHARQRGFLAKLAETARVPHTYLFSGPHHLGKRRIAHEFFASLVADEAESDITETHPDIHIVEHAPDARQIHIDQVRAARTFVSRTPIALSKKLVIIDEAERLGRAGANALLKTLEEPPENAILILIAARPSILPRTIVSRCLHLRFQPLTDHAFLQELSRAGMAVPRRELPWIAGRPGLAVAYTKNKRDPAIQRAQKAFSTLQNIQDGGYRMRISYAEKLAKDEHMDTVLATWMLALRSDLRSRPESSHDIHAIARVRDRLRYTQSNARLQLEGLLFALSHTTQQP